MTVNERISTKGQDEDEPTVGVKENVRVRRSKLLVILVLVLVAVAMSVFVYSFVTAEEEDDFENQFKNYASEIIAVSKENVLATFSTMELFAVSISSLAKATNQEWPFVTLPDFEAMAYRVKKTALVSHFVWGPVITLDERKAWEEYSVQNREEMIQQTLNHIEQTDGRHYSLESVINRTSNEIYTVDRNRTKQPENGPGPFMPTWQDHPYDPEDVWTNYNLLSWPSIEVGNRIMSATMSPALTFAVLYQGLESQMLQPIYNDVDVDDPKIVGALWVPLSWQNYFTNVLSDNAKGVVVVLRSSCGESITYQINGLDPFLLGEGDVHDPKYDHLKITTDFQLFEYDTTTVIADGVGCIPQIFMDVYPSDTLKDQFTTKHNLYYMLGIIGIFAFTMMVFVVYTWAVKNRQEVVMDRVIVTDRIVSDMFPTTFRDRLYALNNPLCTSEQNAADAMKLSSVDWISTKLTHYLDEDDLDNIEIYDKEPLADLFPETTVFVADIACFTAWSSQREPTHVFLLLEAIYGAFDKIANYYGVFKVETVGDCYVAVAGLPEPNTNHVVLMSKFARDCMRKVKDMTHKLEVALGPDTGDLEMRMGLHSGQVTAGVLRGKGSRFQLFGDTVDTAFKMQQTSRKGWIHVSNVTASLLRDSGFSKWLVDRDDTVVLKGKGQMQTSWLLLTSRNARSATTEDSTSTADSTLNSKQQHKSAPKEENVELSDEDAGFSSEHTEEFHNGMMLSEKCTWTKTERLIKWNVDTLRQLLQKIVASRDSEITTSQPGSLENSFVTGRTVLEEFDPIIQLPNVEYNNLSMRINSAPVELDEEVTSQLHDYITRIAENYHSNPFHNFEHASHVASSIKKMLSRIVGNNTGTIGESDERLDEGGNKIKLVDLQGQSFGITSDPLTQFAVVFAGLIHDVDHQGVTNAQLVKEEVDIAKLYQKSVAEQNSVKVAWDILMEPKYTDLRACIYSNKEELKRFRQLLVNGIMATDIADKELQAARKLRWEVAFTEQKAANESLKQLKRTYSDESTGKENSSWLQKRKPKDASCSHLMTDRNRKATIVIEHLIQASDVSHTFQHWQIYRQWNECLFLEMLTAYLNGRADTNPKEFWYKGEIAFFDFYLIPLAKKLESCGVFGVSSHEYLSYAEANREEWILKGEEEVRKMVEKFKA